MISNKKITQYDLNSKLIRIYQSMSNAARELNLQYSNIWKVYNNERKTCSNFIFKYL
ncbi:NUMOD1 domain-containing DNA-binding protein [Campylobacter coli]